MWGDFWAEIMVPAIIDFTKIHPDVGINIYGDRETIEDAIFSTFKMSSSVLWIIWTQNDILDNDTENPLRLLAKWKESSIMKWTQSVASWENDGFLTRGNTWALIMAAKRNVGLITEWWSTALSVWIPKIEWRDALLMDVWAEVDTTLEHLIENARMGDEYLQRDHGIEQPKIALMNLGKEKYKWDKAYREAHKELSGIYGERFIWNIEPNTLTLPWQADLYVSWWKMWNTIIKSMEWTFTTITNEIKEAAFWNKFDKIVNAYAWWKIKKKLRRYNPDNRPDGTIHGINGKVVKVHGSAPRKAVVNWLVRMVSDIYAEKNKEA